MFNTLKQESIQERVQNIEKTKADLSKLDVGQSFDVRKVSIDYMNFPPKQSAKLSKLNKTFDNRNEISMFQMPEVPLSPKRDIQEILKTLDVDNAAYENILTGADELLSKAN